jgi:cysteine desulfurase/selenocysteine lyase
MKDTKLDLSGYRTEFPFTKNVTFLKHASFGPIPQRSWEATQEYYRYLSVEKTEDIDREAFKKLDEIRILLAKMIHARPEEIGFVTNTTYGLNIAAWGLDLKSGDEVLLPDVEFPANVYPWTNLKQKGVEVKFVPSRNGFFDIDNFVKAIDGKSKVLALSSVQFFNGYKNDLKTIGEICQQKDIFFVVDAIQGVGAVDLDTSKLQIDLLSCGGEKWLLSSLGTGFFYLSSSAKRKINPVFFSWLSVDWNLNFTDVMKYDLHPFPSARKFELGTYPYSLLWTMHSSLQLLSEVGIKNIEKHNLQLLDLLIGGLREKGYPVTSSLEKEHRSSILSFSGKNIRNLYEKLLKRSILVSLREGSIRVAPHFYNTEEEIHRLIEML